MGQTVTAPLPGGMRKVVSEGRKPTDAPVLMPPQPALGGLRQAASTPPASPDPMAEEPEVDWLAEIMPGMRENLTEVSRRSGPAGWPIQAQMALEGLLNARKARTK